MNMNFRETYKEENAAFRPDPAFVENMIAELNKAQSLRKRGSGFKPAAIILSAAAAICLVIVGAFVLSDNNNWSTTDTEQARDNGLIPYNANGNGNGVGNVAVEDPADELGEDFFRANDAVVDGEADLADDERENENIKRSYERAGGAGEEPRIEAAEAPPEDDGLNISEDFDAVSEINSVTADVYSNPFSGHPIAEAMYELIIEIFKTVMASESNE